VFVPVVLLLAVPAQAQFSYFDKNKVQSRDYQFESYETEHFKILFYPGGEALAEFSAKVAERYYSAIAQELGMELAEKVPLILYLSPSQFSETNVVTDVLEEGVAGFAELFKNRIVVPFDGSYNNLEHVIGHELTHIFEFQMFYRSKLAALLGAVDEFQIPLWVIEGFAEFQSGWTNVGSEVFMRDLVINGRLLSLTELNDNYGYLAYREGESFFRFVAERYGREKVYAFLYALKNKRNLAAAFSAVFGLSQARFSKEWEKWLKMKYWPQVTKLAGFDSLAQRLTDHTQDGSVYNTAPAISASGSKIAFISDRAEYVDCYIISALNGQLVRRLVRGERSGGFETMHLVRPGVAWSPDETLVALVTRSAGRDNIALIDVRTGRVRRRIYGNLDGLFTPQFSPDGTKLVFVGLKNGFSDIYVVNVAGGAPERVTYDMFEDKDPSFSPSGDSIVFVSDRPDPGQEWIPGRYALWLRSGSGETRRLTERASQMGYPVFSHSGDYLFYTAADSSQNIYGYSLASGRTVRRTDFLGEASYLTLSQDDRKLAFAYFSNVGWDVALMLDPVAKIGIQAQETLFAAGDTTRFEKSGLDFDKVKPVGFSLSLDYVAGAASYSPGTANSVAGTADIVFSDILGNHRFELYTDLYGDILSSNFIFQYWLLPFRVDYGFTFFQLLETPYYYQDSILVYRVNRGVQALAGYPFNRFVRVEAGLTGYLSSVDSLWWNEGWFLVGSGVERVMYGSGAVVLDNTFWTEQGPARGTRARFEAGATFLSHRVFQYGYGDFRNYQRLGRRFVFATRFLGIAGFGRDRDLYYIGGEDVRGYNWGEFYRDFGPGLGLVNLELRYPFIDRLKLAFPLPLDIKGVRGVAFADGGLVFRDGLKIWDSQSHQLQDLKIGVGAGLRIRIAIFYLKLDFAKPLSATADKSWKFILGLGSDF